MTIRDMVSGDEATIFSLQKAMNIDYTMPNLSGKLMILKQVALNSRSRIVGAAAVKLIGEAFLWLDPSTSDLVKTTTIYKLTYECLHRARMVGLEDGSIWVPPSVESYYGRLLSRLGWRRSVWPSWSIRI